MRALRDWYKNWRDHPSDTIVALNKDGSPKPYHGIRIDKEVKEVTDLTKLQHEHNTYSPIEAYYEEWEHITDRHGKFLKAYPKPGTRRRQDLPPLAEQWREDNKARSLK